MPRIVQHRRGTTAEIAGITGAVAELFVDTSNVTLVVMDGVTQGGTRLATESSVTSLASTVSSVSSTVSTNTTNIAAVSSTVAAVSSVVASNTADIAAVSSSLAAFSIDTATTTVIGIVRPDNSSINVNAGVLSLGSSITASWTIQQVGNGLIFYFNGTPVVRFSSNGAIASVDNVTAYTTLP